jgi:hypothetical protein
MLWKTSFWYSDFLSGLAYLDNKYGDILQEFQDIALYCSDLQSFSPRSTSPSTCHTKKGRGQQHDEKHIGLGR